MKLAICGSRDIEVSPYFLRDLLKNIKIDINNPDQITEIVSGGARGMDTCAKRFANHYNVPLTEFHADWDKLGKKAGMLRNIDIAKYSDCLIIIRYEDSKGSIHVSEQFKKLNKKVLEIVLPKEI